MKKPTTIELMKHNIKAYNKRYTQQELDSMTPLQLLHSVHPNDRGVFALALKNEGILTLVQIEEYLR